MSDMNEEINEVQPEDPHEAAEAVETADIETPEAGETAPVKAKKPLLLAILLSVCFSFNLFAFSPLETCLMGSSDFWFGISAVLIPILGCFALFFLISFLLSFNLKGKLWTIIVSLIFSGTIASYIQRTFMSKGYPIMDGEAIQWGHMIGKGIASTAMWLVVIALPLVIAKASPTAFKKLIPAVSVIVLGMEVAALVSLFIVQEAPVDQDYYLTTEQEFDLSTDENIVTLISDTFESPYMERALKEQPEIKEKLKDFTYYPNTTGVASVTFLSMTPLLTGEVFPLNEEEAAGIKQCFDKTDFYEYMHSKDYLVNYYTDGTLLNRDLVGKVDNLIGEQLTPSPQAVAKISYLIYKYSFFRCAPHFLKPLFVVDTNDFAETQKLISTPVYFINDINFRRKLLRNGISADVPKKQYSLYHLMGLHAPTKLDRDFNQVVYKNEDTPSPTDRRYEQALAQIKLLSEYTDALKASGAYDRTTIIYTADHGFQKRYNPVMLIKPAGEHSDFKVSEAPLSLLEDYLPFIKELADGKGKDASLYQIPENAERTRYVYNYMFKGEYGSPSYIRSKISVNGPAVSEKSYHVELDEFAPYDKNTVPYTLGDKVSLKKCSEKVRTFGLAEGRAISRTAELRVTLPEGTGALDGTISLEKVIHNGQKLIIRQDGEVIYNADVPKGTKTVNFKTLPASGKELVLALEFPNTVRSTQDFARLPGVEFHSMEFASIVLE